MRGHLPMNVVLPKRLSAACMLGTNLTRRQICRNVVTSYQSWIILTLRRTLNAAISSRQSLTRCRHYSHDVAASHGTSLSPTNVRPFPSISCSQTSLFCSRNFSARNYDSLSRDSLPLRTAFSSSQRLFSSSSSSSSDSVDSVDDYYEVLGIKPEANPKEIKAAYIAKSKLYHPDNNPGKETEAQQKFIKVSAAYKTLKSRRHRSEYDVDLGQFLLGIWAVCNTAICK